MSEYPRTDDSTGETYVVVTASLIEVLDGGVWTSRGSEFVVVGHEREKSNGPGVRSEVKVLKGDATSELIFVPYYYRANRAGKGMMRTGLRKG